MSLNEMDCMVLEDALLDLLATIQENVPNYTHTSGETVTQNIFAIASSRKKLKEIRKSHSQDFSIQELKVMYWAIFDLRETTQSFLDSAPLSDPDRDTVIETQRICNRLIRYFAAQFAKDGIDIHKTFDSI